MLIDSVEFSTSDEFDITDVSLIFDVYDLLKFAE